MIKVSPVAVRFDETMFWVTLTDNRILGVPLSWFPRLQDACQEKLLQYELSPGGVHWPALDEDVNVEGLLAGYGDPQPRHIPRGRHTLAELLEGVTPENQHPDAWSNHD